MSNAPAYTADLSIQDDAAILAMWRFKLDTHEIATRLRRPESQVANRLAQLRDELREGNNVTR